MRESLLIGMNVFRQLLRNRILTVLTAFALALVGIVVFLGDLGQEAELRLGRDFGLTALEWVGFCTVLLCHVVLMFEETELKTLSMLLVKPIQRWQYLAGKVLGSVFLLVMNQAVMTLLLWLLSQWRGLAMVDSAFIISGAYLAVAGALFSCVVALMSVLASSVPVCAVYASFTFFLGHFTQNLVEWTQRVESPILGALVKVLHAVVPDFSLFNLTQNLDAVGATLKFSSVFLWPLAYAVLYGGLMLGLAVLRYERREY